MDEDNNPFAGSTHIFASGVAGLEEHLGSPFQNPFQQPIDEEQQHQLHNQQHLDDTNQDEDANEEESLEDHRIYETHRNITDEYKYSDEPSIYITDTAITNGTVLYTIRYTDLSGLQAEARRRYSEFASLRRVLGRLLPTVVVPPLPHKHTLTEYLLNPFNAKTDPGMISSRKRLLTGFLQRCYTIPQIAECIVWRSFLDPTETWANVLISPPITLLPGSNLLAPPLDPTKPSPLHLLLPIPSSYNSTTHIDNTFHDYQQRLIRYRETTSDLGKCVKKSNRHLNGLVRDLGQLGALYNAFSLENDSHTSGSLSIAIEKTGQAIDVNYLNSEALAFKLLVELQEPVLEVNENCKISIEKVLNFHKLKTLQLSIIQSTIKIREDKIKAIQNLQYQSDRLEEVLSKSNANIQSSTISATVSNLHKGDSIAKVSSPWLRLFHGGGGAKANDLSKLNQMQRNEEIEKIEAELTKLNDCLRIVQKDIELINQAIKANLDELISFFQRKWDGVIRNYCKSILIYLKENLKAWEEAKEAVDEI